MPSGANADGEWILLARAGDDETLAALASCAVSVALCGSSVKIVWDGAALRRLVDDRLVPRDVNFTRPGADRVFAEAGIDVSISHFACSAAAEAAGGAARVAPFVREIVGWPTIVAWIREADRVLSF